MRASAAVLALLLAGCVKNVPQDANTGEDGTYDGAESLDLDPTTGKGDTDGSVSYPGGDRVDWIVIELPAGKVGKLDLDLSWESPRAGGDLSFKVYSQWGKELGHAAPRRENVTRHSKKKKAKKSKSIEDATGNVFVEVYASRRADAGNYRLRATFVEDVAIVELDMTNVQVPYPPKLAVVPEVCTAENWDAENPECDPIPKPCAKNDTSCQPPPPTTVTCPNPQQPDRKVPDCLKYFPPCDTNAIDRKNPYCDGLHPDPLAGDVVSTDKWGTSGTEITVNLGSNDKITVGLEGDLVDSSGTIVPKSHFKVATVKASSCTAKIKMREAEVGKYHAVRIYPLDPPALK